MQRSVLIVFSLALCLTAGACRESATDEDSRAKPDSQAPQASKSTETAELGGFMIAAPVRYQNLAIFPVLSKVPKNEDPYITLEEGLKAGTVQVFEVGADGAAINPPPDVPPEEETQEGPGQEEVEETPDQEAIPELPQPDQVAGDVNRLMVLNTSGRPLYLMPGEV
ncbi:MAG: ARPP-1 family domain-containing protein, partial [Planctomycetota bacterium]